MSGDDSDGQRTLRPGKYGKILVYLLIAIAFLPTVVQAAHIVGTVGMSSGDVPLQSPDGMTVFVDTSAQSTDGLLEEPFPTSSQVQVITEDGNATFTAGGDSNATITPTNITGTWTNVTDVDADPNSITIDPADKDSAVVGQEINVFAWRAGIAEDDGTVDFSYGASGPGEVVVQGVAASTRLAAVDAGSNQILDDATSSGGAVTFDALDSGDHNVQIQTFDPAAPTLSNPDPTGGTSSAPQQVSIDVNDGDFPQGDSVDVTIDVDGSQIHSETLSSNGTVTASLPSSAQTGGTHTWSVDASDAFGETTSNSYSYDVPQNLTIRDEETNAIIDDQQVNLTVYTRGSGQQIYNFTTLNGEVDLGSGFPVSEPFIVVADSDGYIDRRIFVQNVYETQTIYLLNESVQHTDVIFRIEDYTGNYPPDDTVLEVQRGIGGNWETVLGDYFGANDQFEAQLRYNVRHRLVLRNSETGDTRTLGSYTPLASGTETITVSPEGELDLTEAHPRFSFDPATRSLPSQSGVNVTASITPGSMTIDNWGVAIYHIAPDGTNTTLSSQSFTDNGGTVNTTVDLSGLEGQVRVVTSYELEGGATGTRVADYVLIGEPTTSMTLLDGLLGMVGLVPDSDSDGVLMLTAMILTVLGTTAVGSVFRMTTEGMGLVTLVLVTGFAVLGWVEYNLLFTLLVLFASIVFIRRRW